MRFRRKSRWIQLALLLALVGFGACAKKSGGGAAGKAGSLSRFALRGDTLYALGGDTLHVLSLEDPERPRVVNRTPLDVEAETLFLHGELLYLGARSGMYVYSVGLRAKPLKLGEHRHVYSCDPVVVQGTTAFVTLRSQAQCRTGENELRILDVTRADRPRLLRSYAMTSPGGLGVDGRLLFLTDGRAGLKVFDVSEPRALRMIQQLWDLRGYDVIPNGGTLIVSAADGLYQYDYRQLPMRRLSRIPIGRRSPLTLGQ